MRRFFLFIIIAVSFLLLQCAHNSKTEFTYPQKIQKCSVAGEELLPSLATWSSIQREKLNTNTTNQIAIAKVDDCEIEFLSECKLPGRYQYEATGVERKQITLDNRSHFEKQLPFEAYSNSIKIDNNNKFVYSYASVGMRVARINENNKGMLTGNCNGATHFVKTMVVGASKMSAVSQTGQTVTAINEAGKPLLCKDGNSQTNSAHCNSIIQLVLTPLSQMTTDKDELYDTTEQNNVMNEAMLAMIASGKYDDADEKSGTTPNTPPPLDDDQLSELTKRILRIPNGGSDTWDVKVAPMIVKEFDVNKTNSIDTSVEVKSIPCEVYLALDHSVKNGRGAVSSLRNTYGFSPSLHWIGNALGFDETVRADTDARLRYCGL